jgi:DoxX-like family
MLWTARIISALPALVLLVDGAMKVGKPEVVVKTTVELGYAETVILPLGLVLLACMTRYLIPRTAVLGAILLTGYVGGAVATHVRAGQGPCEILFPVVLGALLWKGLVLCDDRLRTRMPLCHELAARLGRYAWLFVSADDVADTQAGGDDP